MLLALLTVYFCPDGRSVGERKRLVAALRGPVNKAALAGVSIPDIDAYTSQAHMVVERHVKLGPPELNLSSECNLQGSVALCFAFMLWYGMARRPLVLMVKCTIKRSKKSI